VACYEDDFHPDALADILAQRAAGRYRALGQLMTLIDDVIEHCLASGEFPVHPVAIVNGHGLYERCAPRMFGVFSIEDRQGQLSTLRLLAVDITATAARAAAATRV
jgi:hypothetical protein